MPALSNTKHERFAQELAKGKTADEAYQLAGYSENRGNAARLKANESVEARVIEIQERAAARTETTLADITTRLLAIAAKGEVATEAPMLSVARAALNDVAKLNGLAAPEKLNVTGDLSHTVEAIGISEALGWIAGALREGEEATD